MPRIEHRRRPGAQQRNYNMVVRRRVVRVHEVRRASAERAPEPQHHAKTGSSALADRLHFDPTLFEFLSEQPAVKQAQQAHAPSVRMLVSDKVADHSLQTAAIQRFDYVNDAHH
jgi:hypothetical protein